MFQSSCYVCVVLHPQHMVTITLWKYYRNRLCMSVHAPFTPLWPLSHCIHALHILNMTRSWTWCCDHAFLATTTTTTCLFPRLHIGIRDSIILVFIHEFACQVRVPFRFLGFQQRHVSGPPCNLHRHHVHRAKSVAQYKAMAACGGSSPSGNPSVSRSPFTLSARFSQSSTS